MQVIKRAMLLLLVMVFFLLGGCTSPSTTSVTSADSMRPLWVDKPHTEAGLVGLGQAGRHFRGPQAQRDLAMQRALDEIARQQGVTIRGQSVSRDSLSGGMSTSRYDVVSVQTVDGQQVRASVRYEWHDKDADVLYILMVAD
ncbi:hypothetical protein [Marinospirillum alkaliphilum]|uniref:LPP20 lipoprotein n=1 Tax=Marinospirillum alkaliphilum DSM 21637 TaxID=1122209 RepID=A0A1K2A5S7_9GAMM|nr:hypothetical protein [Marinospirillum alkaliphilum]SFX81037.1 hypothetical protein SAMN02745752_02951 [Marinospirillum alkaliphilum DSM 21637]